MENSWNKRNVWKGIRLFSWSSWLETFRRKFGFHVFKPFLNISFRLSRPFFIKRNWLRQMVNAITERNQNSSVLNSVHHLPKPWSDRFTHVNSRKASCPKACDTASSHRYLALGTFRQRAVRRGCIADCASCILLDWFSTRTRPSFRTARSVKGLGIKLNSRVLRMWRRVANVELSILASCRERRVQQWQMHRKSEYYNLFVF